MRDTTATATATTTAMRAIVQSRYGSADTLSLETVERPTIEPDQVLIEVAAAGVDRGVWHLMTGQPYVVRLMGYGLRGPKQPVPGSDVAGRVVAVGDHVTRFRPGDEVFGIARGSFAQYAAADEDKLALRPDRLTPEEAAVASISGITALQALEDVAELQAGQRVLVIGASGGVGSYAVQIARALGGVVTGVASTAKLDLVRSLGAEHVIDYTHQGLDAAGGDYDVIIDTGGRNSVRTLRRVLAATGTLVIVGGEGGGRITGGVGRQLRATLLSIFLRQRLTTFISTEGHVLIERLAAHLADGSVVPALDRVVRLAEVPDAIRDLEAGRVHGKVGVRIAATA